jgi:hypothetical protein
MRFKIVVRSKARHPPGLDILRGMMSSISVIRVSPGSGIGQNAPLGIVLGFLAPLVRREGDR